MCVHVCIYVSMFVCLYMYVYPAGIHSYIVYRLAEFAPNESRHILNTSCRVLMGHVTYIYNAENDILQCAD